VSVAPRTSRFPVFSALTSGRRLRRVLIAYQLNALVEISVWLAIILWAFDRGGAALTGAVAVVQLLPAALFSPVLSGFGDRMSRGTALMLGYASVAITAAMTTVLLIIDAPAVLVIGSSTLVTLALAVVRPFHFAALPQLADRPQDLVSANALSSVADGAGLFIGPLLAGILVALSSPWLVFAFASIAATIAAVLCAGLGLVAHLDDPVDAVTSTWRTALTGILAMWGDFAAIVLLLVMATRFVVAGAMDVLGVSFSTDVIGTGDAGAGLLLGAFGVGQLAGGFVAASFAVRRRLSPVVLAGCILMGVFVGAVALLMALASAMAALVLAGIGASILLVTGRTLLQRTSDDRALAQVFALQEATALLGLALGSALAPLLIDRLGAKGAFVPLGVGVLLLGVAGFLLMRQLDVRSVWLPQELALLRGVPFLAVLPPYEQERLAHRSTWLSVTRGEVIVGEGETGDDFFIVDSGEFEVWINGMGGVRLLGPGDGFGEVALLHSIRRTATVTALSDGRLLMIGGHDFLAAVTGSEDGKAIAAEVQASYVTRTRSEPTD
jgi:MFS family permease